MAEQSESLEPVDDADIPDWDDPYLEEVKERLMFHYDLEKEYRVNREEFALYGQMRMSSEKHFFHPALRFAYHESTEHLFARHTPSLSVADLEADVELGHALADDWIEADEEHFSTEFTFVSITDQIDDDIRTFVDGFRERKLLKYGYYGHYEIHLVVIDPDDEESIASEEAGVEEAFRVWDPIEHEEPGLLGLISRRLQL